MVIVVTLDSGYIKVNAWVEVDEDEIVICVCEYDGQQVRVDKLHPELERQIEEVAENEWAMGFDES